MNDSTSKNASAPVPGLETRFALVRAYMLDRNVKNYTSVFTAVDPELTGAEHKIRTWWNSKAKLSAKDAPVIERMERVVEHLKAA